MTNLDVESVTHLEPANFWIGPSAVSLNNTVLNKKVHTFKIAVYVLQISVFKIAVVFTFKVKNTFDQKYYFNINLWFTQAQKYSFSLIDGQI